MNDPTIYKPDVITVGALATLGNWSSMAREAFATNTLRAWKADWEVFTESCRVFRLESLPASPKTVRAFVFECLGTGKKPATVRRYVSTIGRAHRASGVLDPTASELLRLVMKEKTQERAGDFQVLGDKVWFRNIKIRHLPGGSL